MNSSGFCLFACGHVTHVGQYLGLIYGFHMCVAACLLVCQQVCIVRGVCLAATVAAPWQVLQQLLDDFATAF